MIGRWKDKYSPWHADLNVEDFCSRTWQFFVEEMFAVSLSIVVCRSCKSLNWPKNGIHLNMCHRNNDIAAKTCKFAPVEKILRSKNKYSSSGETILNSIKIWTWRLSNNSLVMTLILHIWSMLGLVMIKHGRSDRMSREFSQYI